MNMASPIEPMEVWTLPDASTRRRWSASFAAVVLLHLGVGLVVMFWRVTPMPAAAPEPAVLIDMAPPAPVLQPPPPPALREPVIKPLDLPEIEKAEVVIQKRKPKKEVKQEEKKLPDPPRPVTDSRAPAAAPPAGPTAAEISARQTYLSLLASHLERFKRYPYAARRRHQTGTVYLSFSMDRQGRVIAAAIDRSSGHEALDDEVMAMIRRAEPLPPPPPEVPTRLVVPMSFTLK
ncbi:TonB family protein [Parvibaculum sp.]|uniref:energy transducer TonB n=1 Tax=Parvibaculum sp. TaxID=2024848 RepID=UPI002C82D1F0|nr:TonB family protein [Parvibaculum sp.]HUD51827.1 TonB family protein [Parvibaculum sp.]